MKYKGRIISVSFIIIIIFSIRIVVKSHFDSTPHQIPFPAFILIIVGWFLGKEYDKSVYRANSDSLTGLFNRHYVLDEIHKIFAKAKRKNKKVAIILIDVNDFKEINDNFGHDTGDIILKNISDLMISSFKSSDIISRWGGDEFLIISPFTDYKILDEKINLFEQSITHINWESHNISASIGKAIYPVDADNFESLVSKADINMYHSKSRYHEFNLSRKID